MHHNIPNKDIYLPPITLNQPVSTILGYNLPHAYSRSLQDQLIPPIFFEKSLEIQKILLHGNSVKIPSFPQQCREDAQSATSSSEWIDTEERHPIDLSQLSQNIEKSAINRLFSPGNSEDYYPAEPINLEYLKLLSQSQNGDFNTVLGLSKASKKITKNSTNHNHHINYTHNEKIIIPIKNKPSIDGPRKLRFSKLRTKRNPWRPSEDSKLLELVEIYGESWAMISSKLPNRTGKQIRDRYLNILRPNLKKGEWTIQEDALLMALSHKIGHKWSSIAKHMPGRSEAQVKNRFYSHIKKKLEGGKGEEEVISIPRFEPSSASNFLAESTEGEESRRWAEEENQGEASVKIEENEKKRVKMEHEWETKVEADDMKIHTEHHKPARKVLGERRMEENSGSERENEWIGAELNQNVGQDKQGGKHGGNILDHNMQKRKLSVEMSLKCVQKTTGEVLHNVKVSQEKGNHKIREIESEVDNENTAPNIPRINRRGPINEKEVDLVIGILARYYQNSDKLEAKYSEQNNRDRLGMEGSIVDKARRLQQLDVRKANLELLLIKTMEEMDNIQHK